MHDKKTNPHSSGFVKIERMKYMKRTECKCVGIEKLFTPLEQLRFIAAALSGTAANIQAGNIQGREAADSVRILVHMLSQQSEILEELLLPY